MEAILEKSSSNGGTARQRSAAVLKLSGVPSATVGWAESAHKHLRKLVHPNKWQKHGIELVDVATKAFQAVQSAYETFSGNVSTFVPDETDHGAVFEQREAAFAQRAASSSGSDAPAAAYRSLGASCDDSDPPMPPPAARSASFEPTKRELSLQRAQGLARDWHEYLAALEAAGKA